MPKVSRRRQIIQATNVAAIAMMVNSDSGADSDLEDFYFFSMHQLQRWYLEARNSTTRFNSRYNMFELQELPASSFLQLFRMTFPCFLNLLQLIEQNPVFYNNSRNPQREPPIQIAVAICCLGSNGNGSAVYQLKNLFQVGYGTVDLYTRRVIKAIYELRSSLISWPTKCERIESSQVMQDKGLLGCVGFVDGTLIALTQSPEKYFDPNQFLIADSAYTNDQYVVPAYKGKDLLDDWNVDFNYHLAQSQVRIKHAIGILKGRFSSLRKMRSQIRGPKEMKAVVKWIITCIILHNLLADLKDQWNELYEDEIPEPPPDIIDESEIAGYDLRALLRPITLAHFED
ncbi:hypothetical protein MJO29_003534 [Puccinia striiformis f. sp. tritici]|nr:hypothetical protein MJO29_003534 [Puccinia striiformis f. sp. tritici]